MVKIFRGRRFAKKREVALKKKVKDLKAKGVNLKLAVIVTTPREEFDSKYIELKKEAAARVGIGLEVFVIKRNMGIRSITRLLKALNLDAEFQGVMMQMPLKSGLRPHRQRLVELISPQKDVDGLWSSFLKEDQEMKKMLKKHQVFVHSTTLAILKIIKQAEKKLGKKKSVLIVGASGMVGRPTRLCLENLGYQTHAIDKKNREVLREWGQKSDILISATGHPGLIRTRMIKNGAIVIDVGAPKPDVDTKRVSQKASFITPVPRGVGPVTIVCLLENLVKAAYNTL